MLLHKSAFNLYFKHTLKQKIFCGKTERWVHQSEKKNAWTFRGKSWNLLVFNKFFNWIELIECIILSKILVVHIWQEFINTTLVKILISTRGHLLLWNRNHTVSNLYLIFKAKPFFILTELKLFYKTQRNVVLRIQTSRTKHPG